MSKKLLFPLVLVLCFLAAPAFSAQGDDTIDLPSVAADFVAGRSTTENLLEAIQKANGPFESNLEIVLRSILRANISDVAKMKALKDFESGLKEVANTREELFRTTPADFRTAAAMIGAVAWIIFGPSAHGHDQIDFIIIPLLNAAGNGLTGGLVGWLIGAGLSLPLAFYDHSHMTGARFIEKISQACDQLLSQTEN